MNGGFADGLVTIPRKTKYSHAKTHSFIHCLAKITVMVTITVILAKHCIKLPDDGSLVIRNMLEQYGEVSSVKNTTIHIWLNDGVY